MVGIQIYFPFGFWGKLVVRFREGNTILHQLIGCLSHYLLGFIHPRWLAGFLPSIGFPFLKLLGGNQVQLWDCRTVLSWGSSSEDFTFTRFWSLLCLAMSVRDLISKIMPDVARIKTRLDVASEMDTTNPQLPEILDELVVSATPTDSYALPTWVIKRLPASWMQPRELIIFEAEGAMPLLARTSRPS